jgi:hypothetical protein
MEMFFKISYSLLFSAQIFVWISAVTLFCCLRKYLKPVELAIEAESEEELIGKS